MASFIYNNALYAAMQGQINFETGTFKAMLVGNGYVPNKDTHTHRDDITNEASGTGYTAGGQIVDVSVSINNGTDTISINLPAVSWPAATITGRYIVYYLSRGGAASLDELIAVIDPLGQDVTVTNNTFAVSASTLNIVNA